MTSGTTPTGGIPEFVDAQRPVTLNNGWKLQLAGPGDLPRGRKDIAR